MKPRRRTWLIIPHVGGKSVRGESNYLLWLDVARHFVEKSDYVHFAVDCKVPPSEAPRMEGLFYHFYDPPARGFSYYNRMALLPQELLHSANRRCGTLMVDGVLTSRPYGVDILKVALSAVDVESVPVIYLEPGADDKTKRLGNPEFVRGLVAAWTGADACVLLSRHEVKVVTDLLGEHVTSAKKLRFMEGERVLQIPVGIPVDKLTPLLKSPKNDVFTLFFGARAKDVKRMDEVAKLYDRVYRSGRKVRMVFCTPTVRDKAVSYIGKATLQGNPEIVLKADMGRDAYLEEAAKAHLFVAMSTWEGFPVGFWEQLCLGLVGIFPKRPWALGQIPDDYPEELWFSKPEEAFGRVLYAMDNYEAIQERLEPIRERIRTEYAAGIVWEKLRERAIAVSSGRQWKMMASLQTQIDKALVSLGTEFTLQDAISFACSTSTRVRFDDGTRGEDFKFPGNYDFFRYILTLGYDYRLEDNGTRVVFTQEKEKAAEK